MACALAGLGIASRWPHGWWGVNGELQVIGLPELPKGSGIRVEQHTDTLVLSWRCSIAGFLKWLAVRAIAFVLVLCVVVLVLVVSGILEGYQSATPNIGIMVFAAFVVCLSSVLWRLVVPRHQKIVLGLDQLAFAGAPCSEAEKPICRPAEPESTTCNKRDVQRIGLFDGQAVTVPYRSDEDDRRLGVGACLSAADREWLCEVLRRWRGTETSDEQG